MHTHRTVHEILPSNSKEQCWEHFGSNEILLYVRNCGTFTLYTINIITERKTRYFSLILWQVKYQSSTSLDWIVRMFDLEIAI